MEVPILESLSSCSLARRKKNVQRNRPGLDAISGSVRVEVIARIQIRKHKIRMRRVSHRFIQIRDPHHARKGSPLSFESTRSPDCAAPFRHWSADSPHPHADRTEMAPARSWAIPACCRRPMAAALTSPPAPLQPPTSQSSGSANSRCQALTYSPRGVCRSIPGRRPQL